MNLETILVETLLKLGFDQTQIAQKWRLLDKKYSQQNRYYHNWRHIEAMIACWQQYNDQLENPIEVLLAIYYHDAIYVSSRQDNELKSAELAVKQLEKANTIRLDLVFDLILCTKTHEPQTNDQNWLVDFDLKILGTNSDDYEEYQKQIRKEYRIYPNFMYKPGRKKALHHFLNKEFIFHTDVFRKVYEAQARENTQAESTKL